MLKNDDIVWNKFRKHKKGACFVELSWFSKVWIDHNWVNGAQMTLNVASQCYSNATIVGYLSQYHWQIRDKNIRSIQNLFFNSDISSPHLMWPPSCTRVSQLLYYSSEPIWCIQRDGISMPFCLPITILLPYPLRQKEDIWANELVKVGLIWSWRWMKPSISMRCTLTA